MKVMLDLFSGLGGASEAFIQDDNWTVIRLENNPDLQSIPSTTMMNVEELEVDEGSVDVIWASPPCTEFAKTSMPWTRSQLPDGFSPDMGLLLHTMRIIHSAKPQWWIIENVRGAVPYFRPFLGEPRQIIGPTFLWGNFPWISVPPGWKHTKKEGDVTSTNPMRSNIRAYIPWEISAGLKREIECQTQLFDWKDFVHHRRGLPE